MEKFYKSIKVGLLSSLWNSLPLVMICGAVFLFFEVRKEEGYYAAILFFAAVVLFVSAILFISLNGFLQIDYEELADKRSKELGLKFDNNNEEIIDDITEDKGAQIICLTSPTEF